MYIIVKKITGIFLLSAAMWQVIQTWGRLQLLLHDQRWNFWGHPCYSRVHKCNGMWWNMTTYVCKGQNTSLQHQSKHQSNPQTVSELQWEGLYMYERIARCTCKLIHENMHSNNHTVKESRSPRNCATSRRAFCFHIFARWSRKPEDACLIHSWYEFKVLELLEHSFL